MGKHILAQHLKQRYPNADAFGVYIESKITVLADLTNPPPQKVFTFGGVLRVIENEGGRILVAPNGEVVSESGDFAFGVRSG
jgi:hypothetical protein